jgi:hypothetical protein
MTNTPRDMKKSQFPAQSTIPEGAYFDCVVNGTNIRISATDMIAAFGTVGTLVQLGAITGTPVLNISGTVNRIRNIEGGSGVKTSLSPSNGVLLDHNFIVDETGVAILKDKTAESPTLRSILGSAGINVSVSNGAIQIALSDAPASTKTVIVNSITDFPAAVSGVITFEGDTQYFIANDITTASRFVFGEDTALTGAEGTLVTLEYTGSGVMFTGPDTSNRIRELTLNCPNGTLFDITGSSGKLFSLLYCYIPECDYIGDFTNIFDLHMETCHFYDIKSGGMTFSGANGHFLLSSTGVYQNGGTFLDLGSSTFDSITMSSIFGYLDTGTTFISGLADSGNVNTGGGAHVAHSIIPGPGAMLDTITTQDALWSFNHVGGITDSRSTALSVCSGMTVTIGGTSTPVKVDSNWSDERSSRFDINADGTFTYEGGGDFISFTSSLTVDVASGTNLDLNFYFYKNGVKIDDSVISRQVDAGSPGNVSMVWSDELELDDYLEIWCENTSSTANIIIDRAIMRFD